MTVGSMKAQQVIDEVGIRKAKDLQYLKEICMERKVFVRESRLDGAEARLVVSGTDGDLSGVIVVSPNNSYETRTRFSIAHELGHFEMHRDVVSTISCTQAALNEWFGKLAHQRREADANEFASELLMPEQFIKKYLNVSRPNLDLIESVANDYDCSLIAVARRLIDLTDEACALVFFKEGRVSFHLPSKLFKQQYYWIAPGPLSSETYAYESNKNGNGNRSMSMVDAMSWIDTSDMEDWKVQKLVDKTILEQARFFPRLKMGISLLQLSSDLIWN